MYGASPNQVVDRGRMWCTEISQSGARPSSSCGTIFVWAVCLGGHVQISLFSSGIAAKRCFRKHSEERLCATALTQSLISHRCEVSRECVKEEGSC